MGLYVTFPQHEKEREQDGGIGRVLGIPCSQWAPWDAGSPGTCQRSKVKDGRVGSIQ